MRIVQYARAHGGRKGLKRKGLSESVLAQRSKDDAKKEILPGGPNLTTLDGTTGDHSPLLRWQPSSFSHLFRFPALVCILPQSLFPELS